MKTGLPQFTKNNTIRNYSLSPDSKNLLTLMSPNRNPAPTPTRLKHNKTFDNTTLSKKRENSMKQPMKLLRRRKKGSLAAENLSVMQNSPHWRQIEKMGSDFLPLIRGKTSIGRMENSDMFELRQSLKAKKTHDLMIEAIQHSENIKTELDINYELVQQKLLEETQNIPEFSIPVTPSLTSRIPFDKMTPPSLYNARKNFAGYDRATSMNEVKRQLEQIVELVSDTFPQRKVQFSRFPTDWFANELQSESREYYDSVKNFVELINLIMQCYKEKEKPQESKDTNEFGQTLSELAEIIERQSNMSLIQRSRYPTGQIWDDYKELTKHYRAVMKFLIEFGLTNSVVVLEKIWKSSLHLSDTSILWNKVEFQEWMETEKAKVRDEKKEHENAIKVKIAQWERKIEGVEEESAKLVVTIKRLRDEKEEFISLLKEREEEIRKLRLPSEFPEFMQMMKDLDNYLTETVEQHDAQAQVLSQIEAMLKHDWNEPKPEVPLIDLTATRATQTEVKLTDRIEVNRTPSKKGKMLPPPTKIMSFINDEDDYPDKDREKSNPNLEALSRKRSVTVNRMTPIFTDEAKNANRLGTGDTTGSMKPYKSNRGKRNLNIPVVSLAIPTEVPNYNQDDAESPIEQILVSRPFGSINNANQIHEDSDENDPVAQIMRLQAKNRVRQSFSADVKSIGLQTVLTLDDLESILQENLPNVDANIRRRLNTAVTVTTQQQIEYLDGKQFPMTELNVFKLFESSLDEKVKTDALEEAQGKLPRTLAEFTIDYVLTQYGLKTLALKQLSGLVNSLEKMSKSQHLYGVIYCRMLDIFTDSPINYKMFLFLTKARQLFVEIQNRLGGKQTVNKDLVVQGGDAPFFEVIGVISQLYAMDRESGESVLSRMTPHCMRDSYESQKKEYIVNRCLIMICGKLQKLNKDLRHVFNMENPENSALSYAEFSSIIRRQFGVWILQSDLDILMAKLDPRKTKYIEYNNIMKVNFSEYSSQAYGKQWWVTKCDFMSWILSEEGIKEQRENNTVDLKFEAADNDSLGYLTSETFRKAMFSLDSEMLETQIAKLFQDAIEIQESEQISDSTFRQLVLAHRIGGLGKNVLDEFPNDDETIKHDKFIDYTHKKGNKAIAIYRKHTKFATAKK